MLPDQRFRLMIRFAPLAFGLVVAISCWPGSAVKSQPLRHSTSWLANSVAAFNPSRAGRDERLNVQHNIADIWVSADGTCYTTAPFSEGGHDAGVYKDGKVLYYVPEMSGFNRHAGLAITGNSRYLFVASSQANRAKNRKTTDERTGLQLTPQLNQTWYGVRRFQLDGGKAGFAKGINQYRDLLLVNTDQGQIQGVAASEDRLFVSDTPNGVIKVYRIAQSPNDPNDMAPLAEIPAPRIYNMAYDEANNALWAVSLGEGGTPSRILCFTGERLTLQNARGIALPPEVVPSGMAMDNKGHLLVTDNGPNQQVLIYGGLGGTPTLDRTFGEKGGIYSGTGTKIGTAGPLRFNGLSGVGTDAAGNIYISTDGRVASGTTARNTSGIIESYTPAGQLNWSLKALTFVDSVGIDPASDGADVYSGEEHFKMDYSKTAPGSEWSYQGTTLNPFKYQDDPRLHANSDYVFHMARIGGKLFQFSSLSGNGLAIYRFNPETDGEIAIPSVIIAPVPLHRENNTYPPAEPQQGASYIWTDKNGNGRIDANEYDVKPAGSGNLPRTWAVGVDEKGGIWIPYNTQLWHLPCAGLDAFGNPRYSLETATREKPPAPFKDLHNAEYIAATDTMYISGFTADKPEPKPALSLLHIGTAVARYDNWSDPAKRTLRWQFDLPYQGGTRPGTRRIPVGLKVAGDYVFVQMQGVNEVEAHRTSDGTTVGTLAPDPKVAGDYSDIWVDLAMGMNAFARKNGEYLVFSEEDIFCKIFMYRWRGNA